MLLSLLLHYVFSVFRHTHTHTDHSAWMYLSCRLVHASVQYSSELMCSSLRPSKCEHVGMHPIWLRVYCQITLLCASKSLMCVLCIWKENVYCLCAVMNYVSIDVLLFYLLGAAFNYVVISGFCWNVECRNCCSVQNDHSYGSDVNPGVFKLGSGEPQGPAREWRGSVEKSREKQKKIKNK